RQIGHDVAHDDGEGLCAAGLGGLDEFLLLDRQGLPAHDTRHGQPFDTADAHKKQDRIAAEHHHQDDDEEDVGQRIHDVDNAHHDGVDPAAEIASHRTIDDTNADR